MLIAYTSSTQENSTNEKLILFIDIINEFLNKKVNHNDSSYVQKTFTQKMLSQSVCLLFACSTRYDSAWANKMVIDRSPIY